MKGAIVAFVLGLFGLLGLACQPTDGELRVGSKKFTESVVLGELLVQLARSTGEPARHVAELGGTRILFEALVAGELDAYVEYTGTLLAEIYVGRGLETRADLAAALAEDGLVLGPALGFDNSYALGMDRELAGERSIARIGDLVDHPDLRFGFGEEFLGRADGWPGLQSHYGLPQTNVRGLDHDVAYRALAAGDLDVMDLYATDAEIELWDLLVLDDERDFFPSYQAVALWRKDTSARAPGAVEAWLALAGTIDAAAMRRMNREAAIDREPANLVARRFVAEELGLELAERRPFGIHRALLRTTLDHLALVLPSLIAAVLLALPLGIAAARRPRLGQVVLAVTGVLQTIPSLALLVMLVPLVGIGAKPAICALFLYSLLPIVRNTQTGLANLPKSLLESADGLGLLPKERLWLIELPLALPAILAGIKTAAVINIGTATLGALVGAGGYGQPILTGIRLADPARILEGAIPAALMALLAQATFELAERRLSRGGLSGAI